MNSSVFLDANVLIYFLDSTSEKHGQAVKVLQSILSGGSQVYTSHHVIEEVLFIVSKLADSKEDVVKAVKEIAQIPELIFIEPEPSLVCAARYAKLWQKTGLGINDSLLLQLMKDNDIGRLFSYDRRLLKEAAKLEIKNFSARPN